MSNYLLLVAAMISWGLSNPLADWAVSGLSAPAQTLLEISSGLAVISIFYLFRPYRFRNGSFIDVSWKSAALLGAVQPGFAWLMGNYGYTVATASTGVILLNMESLFTVFWAALWLKDRITHHELLALILGIIGATLGSFDKSGISITIGLGALCFLGSSIFCGLNAVAVKRLGANINPITLAFRQALFSTIYALAWWLIFDRGHFLGRGTAIYVAGTLSGVFGVALPIIAFNYAAARVKSSHVAVLFNIVPLVGVFGAIVLGRGAPTWVQVIGGLFVLSSMYILNHRKELESLES
jgi:drug/metabolite transporter (DMT)-like permease